MKGKCVFSFVIVIALAVLSVAAFVYSLSKFPVNNIPEHKMFLDTGEVMDSENIPESEQIITKVFLSLFKTGVTPHNTLIILIFLFSTGNIIARQVRNGSVLRIFAGIVYALAVTSFVGKWGIDMAYAKRGYEAVGGEYCLILIVSWAAEAAITHLIDTLEDFRYEQSCRKERG